MVSRLEKSFSVPISKVLGSYLPYTHNNHLGLEKSLFLHPAQFYFDDGFMFTFTFSL